MTNIVRSLGLAPVIVLGLSSMVSGSTDSKCDYSGYGLKWIGVGHDAEGYWVKVMDPSYVVKEMSRSSDRKYSVARQLPQNEYIFNVAEYLSQEAGTAVFYIGPRNTSRGQLGASTRIAVSIDTTWRGPDPLSCLRSFTVAAGLDFTVPQKELWLIGPPENVENAAILVFAYPIDASLQPLQKEAAIGDLERALLGHLPIRDIGDRAFVSLGYHKIQNEQDTFLVVATNGGNTDSIGSDNLKARAFKVRVRLQGGRYDVECVWSQWVGGLLLAQVQEDFDGDGVQDYYFQQSLERYQDQILSGADGSLIVEARTNTLAIEKKLSGPKLFAVDYTREYHLGHAAVVRFSSETKKVSLAPPIEVSSQKSETQVTTGYKRQNDQPREMLAERLGRRDGIRVYVLPGSRPPGYQTPQIAGVEYVEVPEKPVWNWLVSNNSNYSGGIAHPDAS